MMMRMSPASDSDKMTGSSIYKTVTELLNLSSDQSSAALLLKLKLSIFSPLHSLLDMDLNSAVKLRIKRLISIAKNRMDLMEISHALQPIQDYPAILVKLEMFPTNM